MKIRNNHRIAAIKAATLIGLALWIALLSVLAARAAFEINQLGPKSAAFNDAYSTLASDPWGLLYNPAQITQLHGAQAALAYSRPHLNFGNFRSDLVSGFFTREAMGTGYGVGVTVVDTNVYYREVAGLFNLGRRFGEPEDAWDLSLGTNLKILSLRRGDPLKPYDPALKPMTLNRFTADLGALLRYHKYYLGISAQNVVPANIGVVVKDVVPMETRVGVGAKSLWEFPGVEFKVSPAIEVANRNQDTTASGGAEIQLLDFANFIFGVGTRSVSMGFSVFLNEVAQLAKGQRVKDAPREGTQCRLDVGYMYPITGVDNVGSPLVGMSFLF